MPHLEAARESELSGEGSRIVESQSSIATMALVDTVEQQQLLEELLEQTKPGRIPQTVDYLIGTPFRYPPLKYGSRFGTQQERGIFYGSEELATALAESAFYALRFVAASQGLNEVSVTKTHFRFSFQTKRGLDTTTNAFDQQRAALSSPTNYASSQMLGRSARRQGVEVIRFESARCPNRGANLAVLKVNALTPAPLSKDHWHMLLRNGRVDFIERDTSKPRTHSFSKVEFEVRQVMGHPTVS